MTNHMHILVPLKEVDRKMEISNTRLSIIRAVEAGMEHKSIDKIKVAHVCNNAGISRTTFYEYFTDIYDVVNWLWETLEQDGLLAIGKSLNWHDAHLQGFKNLEKFKNFFKLASRSKDYNNVMDYSFRKAFSLGVERLEERLGRKLSDEELLGFEIYSHSGADITKEWIQNGMVQDPEWITKVLDDNLPDFYKVLLEPER